MVTAPSSPGGWITIAERELGNIKASLMGNASHDAAVHHALSAVEAALKAMIWQREGWKNGPGKQRKTKKSAYLYRHEIDKLLKKSGLKDELMVDPERAASWSTILNASVKDFRYSPAEVEQTVAWAVARSARYLDWGVVPWLVRRFREMT